ncbi:hypothetical protein EW026_g2728 [Hermanssonia centrifuga]|uniref:Endonuclease/exonuclease/phosphatase domain-containing protein n=1 Tax=Hermanssonia centrifuga TaxID=98765 RepID=A0A4V3XAW2_9APHY|nr:hypothetical protein EW026_g2728 [Hermanssonia centrifuga]
MQISFSSMWSLLCLVSIPPLAIAVKITDIQGPAFLSPLLGQTVHDVTGTVTAKSSTGFYIQGEPSSDIRESYGLFVFSDSSSVRNSVSTGDSISLSGVVSEFRPSSSDDQTFLLGTELESPTNIKILSTGNTVAPLLLGPSPRRSPPTQQFSALDLVGPDGWLSVPNNQSRVDTVNATVQPDEFGLDFWSSLEGVLVTVPSPTATDFENSFGEFWVYGDWPITGQNSRGGITLTFGPDGFPDGNPETVIIGSPLDGTDNPSISVGKKFKDITGVVQQQFGFFYVIPLTAPSVTSSPSTTAPPTTLTHSTDACVITIGDYNVREALAAFHFSIPQVADQIANFLKTPDLIFLQEIQDNSGPTDDGVVAADVTLQTLANAITAAGGSFAYNFTEVISVNDQDGGEIGGNIRPAYLFNKDKVTLVEGPPVGGPLDGNQPVIGADGKLTLTFNPGRIDPNNTVWDNARKPIAAAWQTTDGNRFFTINLHDTAKSGGEPSQGDPRPPINTDVTKRAGQVQVIATFAQALLALDPGASLIVAGDYNEFVQTRSVFAPFNNILFEVDEIANISIVERYTYVFDNENEQLDHIFVSKAVIERQGK